MEGEWGLLQKYLLWILTVGNREGVKNGHFKVRLTIGEGANVSKCENFDLLLD